MNKAVISGRLTKDPDCRQNGDLNIARFTVAVDRRSRNEEKQTDFIPCVAFGKTAEIAGQFLQKGSKVGVTGNIKTGSYTNKEGQKVYTTDVYVEDIEFLDTLPKPEAKQEEPVQETMDGFMRIPEGIDEELPFN